MRWSVGSLAAIIALPIFTCNANATEPPAWVGQDVFYGQTKDQTILYAVGRHPVGRACGSMWTSQVVDFASTKARNALVEYLGKAEGGSKRTTVAHNGVTDIEYKRYRPNEENGDELVDRRTLSVEQADLTTSFSTHKKTPEGIKGVRTMRAFFDPATQTIYALAAMVVKKAEVPMALLPKMSPTGGQSLHQAERAARQGCSH